MNEENDVLQFSEGDEVIYSGQPARINTTDRSDQDLPYYIDYVDDEGHPQNSWVHASELSAKGGTQARIEVEDVAGKPVTNQDGEQMTPYAVAVRLRTGLRDGDVTLNDLQNLATVLVAQLDDASNKAKPQVAKGLCSACMDEVTFDAENGTWTHADPQAGHQPPAIIPRSVSMTDIGIQTWYLEFIEGTSKKFYRVHLTEDGVVSTGWGRLYTSGQSSVQRMTYDDAKAVALRQVYAKAAKGYTMKTDGFRWEIDGNTVASAVATEHSTKLDLAFEKALSDPRFDGDKAVVARLYRTFTERAEALMHRAASEGFDEVLPEFDQVQKSWGEIADMHNQAATVMDLTNKMLMDKLMGSPT